MAHLHLPVELTHFNLLRSVGKGAFGKVRVVQHKGTQKIYALKYINKAKCIKMKAVENIIQERRLLEEAQHPFICNLRFAFQDDENLFMVLDLMLGGDLRFHLDRMGTFKEDMVRFYVAEIALGLSYLHSRRIVHRDLKPDNVLLDEHGHASLTDFNIAVHYREEKPLTAVAGSMAYMAPEVLGKKGYWNAVDWWSLGVMAFELLYGKRPFRSKTNDGLTHAILHDHLHFPSEPSNITQPAKDCLKGFITRNVGERLGSRESGGEARIKNHPWFEGLDWAKLEAKELTPPFVPDSKKANFDATHELEELLLEDNPLKAKPRKKNAEGKLEPRQPPPGEDPEVTRLMNVMEEKFIVFDYTKPKLKTSQLRLNANMDVRLSSHALAGPAGGAQGGIVSSAVGAKPLGSMNNLKKGASTNAVGGSMVMGPVGGAAGGLAAPVAGNQVANISAGALPPGAEVDIDDDGSLEIDPMEGRTDAVFMAGMTDTGTGTGTASHRSPSVAQVPAVKISSVAEH
ncbi:hypothetical protein HDU96_008730 [Phlyctochytrium bullatum]|nr:hypothetical protein HDU96_008730 [Phlyctochytrium bullatum]